jgi:hypothetical protein
MEKKPKHEIAKTKPINIVLPEELLERVRDFCAEQEMGIHEFVTDAIIEKLELAHKETKTNSGL